MHYASTSQLDRCRDPEPHTVKYLVLSGLQKLKRHQLWLFKNR